MYAKTDAVILSVRKHRDNCLLLQLFTREMGRASFVLYGAHSKRGGRQMSFLQPFSFVSVDTDFRPNRELQVIKEIKNINESTELLFDPCKNTVALFLAEVLLHALRTNERDVPLFEFLRQSSLALNSMERGVANFHIAFLVRLSFFLGFHPDVTGRYRTYFDMVQAEYTGVHPSHNHYVKGDLAMAVAHLSRMNYRNLHRFRFLRTERVEALERILEYYKIHLQGFGEISSLAVLREVFD